MIVDSTNIEKMSHGEMTASKIVIEETTVDKCHLTK